MHDDPRLSFLGSGVRRGRCGECSKRVDMIGRSVLFSAFRTSGLTWFIRRKTP